MNVFVTITQRQDRDRLFSMMQRSAADHLDASLAVLGMDLKTFRGYFESLGEITAYASKDAWKGFYWVERRDDVLHLHALVVEEDARSMGLGGRMLTHIEETYGSGVTRIQLGVHKDNAGAIRLYERHGYDRVSTLEDVGYHIMQKRISCMKGHPLE